MRFWEIGFWGGVFTQARHSPDPVATVRINESVQGDGREHANDTVTRDHEKTRAPRRYRHTHRLAGKGVRGG